MRIILYSHENIKKITTGNDRELCWETSKNVSMTATPAHIRVIFEENVLNW